ncbi:hypothetical protein SAMN04488238_103206 [Roseicitreum antarcticum]|uniref:Uncharacterized protein n=1 Tax=Roseicitreum antarcticum TaxID=564137 RepID=A0A1H2VXI2_9RHOB|nr:hypothetical protein SAMN04488238_103206 [Roseicitreum antarcticum]
MWPLGPARFDIDPPRAALYGMPSRGWLDDRVPARVRKDTIGREESPDSMKEGCRVTPGRGNPRESATENRRPHRPGNRSGVTVKRWGKSPPRAW